MLFIYDSFSKRNSATVSNQTLLAYSEKNRLTDDKCNA